MILNHSIQHQISRPTLVFTLIISAVILPPLG